MYILLTIQELSYQNFKLDSFIYVNDPTRVLFLFSCILTVLMLSARFTCSLIIDDVVCVFAALTRAPSHPLAAEQARESLNLINFTHQQTKFHQHNFLV